MREQLNFSKNSQFSDVSVDEMHSRATQLVKIQEYDIAEELYAEILKKDHQNELAKQRLTSLQRVKYGIPPSHVDTRSVREVGPEQRSRQRTVIARSELPVISPGIKRKRPPFAEEYVADNRNLSFSLDHLQTARLSSDC